MGTVTVPTALSSPCAAHLSATPLGASAPLRIRAEPLAGRGGAGGVGRGAPRHWAGSRTRQAGPEASLGQPPLPASLERGWRGGSKGRSDEAGGLTAPFPAGP